MVTRLDFWCDSSKLLLIRGEGCEHFEELLKFEGYCYTQVRTNFTHCINQKNIEQSESKNGLKELLLQFILSPLPFPSTIATASHANL